MVEINALLGTTNVEYLFIYVCNFLFLQGINIVGPSNAEQPPCPAMYQLDIVLKKGNNLAIRDRTGRRFGCSPWFVTTVRRCKLLE